MAQAGSQDAELTHSQTQIWVGQRLHPTSPLYNMAFAFVFPAELRADLFARAWRRVVDGSDVLRTRIVEQEGGARRTLAPAGAATAVLDFASRPDPEEEFRRWCRERCARPLALGGDLVDSVLVRLGDERTGWYLNQHHLVADAWSTQLLYRQVAAEYEALLGGDGGADVRARGLLPDGGGAGGADRRSTAASTRRASSTGPPARSARDAGAALRPQRRAGGHGEHPPDPRARRGPLPGARSALRARTASSACPTSCRASRSSRPCWSSWLHRISGRAELGFDAPVAGRPTAEAKRALGLFIEMFPFAATVEPDDTFRSLGARCLEEAKRFLRHALPGLSSPSGAAASNVVLNYFPGAFGDFAGLPVEVEWVHPGHGDSVHALRLQVHDFSGSGRYTLHFDCNEGALPERLRRRGVEHFEKILGGLLDDPDRPIASVDVPVEDERRSRWRRSTPPTRRRCPIGPWSPCSRPGPSSSPTGWRCARGGPSSPSRALRQQSEALAATLVGARRRARRSGRDPRPAVDRCRRRHPRDAAGAGGLRAHRALRAAGPPASISCATPAPGCCSLGEGAEDVAPPADGDQLADRRGHPRRRRHDARPVRPGPRRPRLPDLHLRLHRPAQGRSHRARRARRLSRLGGAQYVRGDRLTFPLFTSLAFDLTVTSLFLPLITGGTLEIYPEPDGPVDTALMDVVRANAVDFIKLTPSHLSLLARIGLEGSRIRRMVVGGENLATRLAAAISTQLHDRVEIYNEYGPTEAVVGCVAHRYDPAADTGASVPIGAPADHVGSRS